MGWSSGGEIFEVVADALLEAGASDNLLHKVLSKLLKELRAADWDTEDEAMDRYLHVPVIVGVFYNNEVRHTIGSTGDERTHAVLSCEQWPAAFVLHCDGPADHGTLARWPVSIEGHNRMLQHWGRHDADHHGGDGTIEAWRLLRQR